jgi:hypothetical protein
MGNIISQPIERWCAYVWLWRLWLWWMRLRLWRRWFRLWRFRFNRGTVYPVNYCWCSHLLLRFKINRKNKSLANTINNYFLCFPFTLNYSNKITAQIFFERFFLLFHKVSPHFSIAMFFLISSIVSISNPKSRNIL